MNSRERVLTTLKHQQADRVPIAEMWITPHVVQAFLPGACDTVEGVVAPAKGLLLDASAKAPRIVFSGNPIVSCVRAENYVAMVRTRQEFGRYPIHTRTI